MYQPNIFPKSISSKTKLYLKKHFVKETEYFSKLIHEFIFIFIYEFYYPAFMLTILNIPYKISVFYN